MFFISKNMLKLKCNCIVLIVGTYLLHWCPVLLMLFGWWHHSPKPAVNLLRTTAEHLKLPILLYPYIVMWLWQCLCVWQPNIPMYYCNFNNCRCNSALLGGRLLAIKLLNFLANCSDRSLHWYNFEKLWYLASFALLYCRMLYILQIISSSIEKIYSFLFCDKLDSDNF